MGERFNITELGDIPSGIKAPVMPDVDRIPEFARSAFSIAIVAFAINISMAELFSNKHDYSIRSNQASTSQHQFWGSSVVCICIIIMFIHPFQDLFMPISFLDITYDDSVQSDHSAVIFSVPIWAPSVKRRTVLFRKLCSIDCQHFCWDIVSADLHTADCTAPEAVDTYNDVLSCMLNEHVPHPQSILLLWGLTCPGILWRWELLKWKVGNWTSSGVGHGWQCIDRCSLASGTPWATFVRRPSKYSTRISCLMSMVRSSSTIWLTLCFTKMSLGHSQQLILPRVWLRNSTFTWKTKSSLFIRCWCWWTGSWKQVI